MNYLFSIKAFQGSFKIWVPRRIVQADSSASGKKGTFLISNRVLSKWPSWGVWSVIQTGWMHFLTAGNFPRAPLFHFSSLWIWISFATELEQLLNIHHRPPFFRCQDGARRRVAADQAGAAWEYRPRLPLTRKWFVMLRDRESSCLLPLWGSNVHTFSLSSLSLSIHSDGIKDLSIYSVKTIF